jgi:hypothetical protein
MQTWKRFGKRFGGRQLAVILTGVEVTSEWSK